MLRGLRGEASGAAGGWVLRRHMAVEALGAAGGWVLRRMLLGTVIWRVLRRHLVERRRRVRGRTAWNKALPVGESRRPNEKILAPSSTPWCR